MAQNTEKTIPENRFLKKYTFKLLFLTQSLILFLFRSILFQGACFLFHIHSLSLSDPPNFLLLAAPVAHLLSHWLSPMQKGGGGHKKSSPSLLVFPCPERYIIPGEEVARKIGTGPVFHEILRDSVERSAPWQRRKTGAAQ